MRLTNRIYHRTSRPNRAWIPCTMTNNCPLCNEAGFQMNLTWVMDLSKEEEE